MKTYLDCWISTAKALFPQALAGEPRLDETDLTDHGVATVSYEAKISGDVAGAFAVSIDPEVLETPLLGEGVQQAEAWKELLKEVSDAAAGQLLAHSGLKCSVDSFSPISSPRSHTRSLQIVSYGGSWRISVLDGVRGAGAEPMQSVVTQRAEPDGEQQSLDLLLDVELEAALRFGCCEMPLSEILKLGPGDVIELDRHVNDPVDLIVGDKIVARGEVVLVNGNFGLRVTEVAIPRMRLESIRCLF